MSLDSAYVNFTHWALVQGDHGSIPYQKRGFYVSWLQHNAYICQKNFPSIDLVVPMAFPNKDDVVTPECMSYIVISTDNCEGIEDIESQSLSKNAIEGVVASKTNKKNRRVNKVQGRGKDDGSQYAHSKESLDVRFRLHEVKFINPGGVVSATDSEGLWIQSSEDKPYIAFAMSMGQTDRNTDLFIGEDVNSYQCTVFLIYT
jgi:hypothetical protein